MAPVPRTPPTLAYASPTGSPPRPMAMRPYDPRLIMLAAGAVTLATVAFLAGVNTINVAATVFADGLVPVIDLFAATLVGIALVRRLAPHTGRAPLVASGAGVGLGLLLTLGLLLGLLGLLNGTTSWLLVGLLALLGSVDLYRDQSRWRAPLQTTVFAWLWLLPAIPLGVALVGACLPPGILWGDEPHGYDVLSYHLQIPREWYDAGRIVPLEHNVFSFFPLGQETLSLLLMHQMGGPYEAMYASQLLSTLLMAVATLAVYGAVSDAPVHSPSVGPTAAAVIFATLPWTAMLGSVAYNEALLMLSAALSAAWMLRATGSDWRSGLLAGLFAGLGIAAKYPAVAMLAAAGGFALLAALVVPQLLPKGKLWGHYGADTASPSGEAVAPGWRRSVLTLLAFSAGTLVFALPWLIRNLVWIGNPIFPLATGFFGTGGWDAALLVRWDRVHTLAAGESHLERLYLDVLINPRSAYLLWPAVLLAMAGVVARRDRRGAVLSLWIGLMLLIWLAFTHLQGRFLVTALAPAAMLVGLAVTPRWRTAGAMAALAIALAGLTYLLPTAWQRTAAGRSDQFSLFGFQGLSQLTVLEDAARAGDQQVYLVGDARAFLYQVQNLHYRVVFNVPEAQGALEAWLGEALATAPDDALVVIDPAEVDRLSRSYKTPPLEIPVRRPTVVTMRQLRAALGRAPSAGSP